MSAGPPACACFRPERLQTALNLRGHERLGTAEQSPPCDSAHASHSHAVQTCNLPSVWSLGSSTDRSESSQKPQLSWVGCGLRTRGHPSSEFWSPDGKRTKSERSSRTPPFCCDPCLDRGGPCSPAPPAVLPPCLSMNMGACAHGSFRKFTEDRLLQNWA